MKPNAVPRVARMAIRSATLPAKLSPPRVPGARTAWPLMGSALPAKIGDKGVAVAVRPGMVGLARAFLPHGRVDRREEGIAAEHMVDLGDDHAAGEPDRFIENLGAADDAGRFALQQLE